MNINIRFVDIGITLFVSNASIASGGISFERDSRKKAKVAFVLFSGSLGDITMRFRCLPPSPHNFIA